LARRLQSATNIGLAITPDPRGVFYAYHNHLACNTDFYWTDFKTEIGEGAQVHHTASVAQRNVRIGRRTIIEANTTINERSIIGENVIIRTGVRISTQGFEFKRVGHEIVPVEHAGGVRLGDRVEIQANSAISRSVFGGYTELGDDTKLDNLVHVAHNVIIGKRCFLAAAAMIAGSVTIHDDVWIGPGASVSSGVTIGDKASVTIGAVVTRDVPSNARVSGHFAIDHEKYLAFVKKIR